MRVTVVSNEMVKPETRNEQHPKFLELSVLDQVQYRYHWPPLLAFFGPPKGGMTLESLVQKSKKAFAQALVPFYPLAGRFVHRAEGCLAIDCNDAGILVRVATANCKMPREIATGTNMAGSEKLYAAKRGEDVTTVPPLLVQITRFRDDAISVSFCFHHTVCDGAGYSMFIKYWSELMLGKQPSRESNHDRSRLRVISKPLAKGARAARPGRPALPIPIGVMLMFGIPFLRRRVLPFVPVRLLGWPDVAQYRIAFPNDKLKVLKEDASKGLPAGRFVSSNDALTALLWRSVTAARGLDATQSASIVRDAVSRVDAAYADSQLDQYCAMPNKAARDSPLEMHRGPDLFVTSLTKFPFNETDLGWGPPVSVGVANLLLALDGWVTLIESMGGVCAHVSLLAEHMTRLMADDTFLKYVGS